MASPFDTIAAPAAVEPITPRQRTTLRSMGLEKAELIGLDLQQADDKLDTWLAELDKATATRAIAKLGRWLDDARDRLGIPRTTR